MLAVLENAVRTLLVSRRVAISRKRMRQEVDWFMSTDRTEPFAFESICDVLEIDAGYLRSHLLAGYLPAPRTLRRTVRYVTTRTSKPCSASY